MMGQLILQHFVKAPAPSELRLSWGQIYVASRCQAIKAIGCRRGPIGYNHVAAGLCRTLAAKGVQVFDRKNASYGNM